MSTTSTLTHERTLGPLTAAQRTEIMLHARTLTLEARRLMRRLLILIQGQDRGLEAESIARAAAQARAHFEI